MSGEIEPFYKELGPRIQHARNHRGLSQAQLGAKLRPSLTRASISNIESGTQRIFALRFLELVSILDIDVNDLSRPLATTTDAELEAELMGKLKISSVKAKVLMDLMTPGSRDA